MASLLPFVYGIQEGAEALKVMQVDVRLWSLTYLWRCLHTENQEEKKKKKKAQKDYSVLNSTDISVLTVGGHKGTGARRLADKVKNLRREQVKTLAQRLYLELFSEKGPTQAARGALGTLLGEEGRHGVGLLAWGEGGEPVITWGACRERAWRGAAGTGSACKI